MGGLDELLSELAVPESEVSPSRDEEDEEQPLKRVTVLIPLGLPGMGKSTLEQTLTSFIEMKSSTGSKVHFKIISNDDIRATLVQEHMDENEDVTRLEAF